MTDEETSERADLRIGYRVAAQLVTHEAYLSWRVTGIFVPFATILIGGAIFPSFIGVVSTRAVAVVATIFSCVGIATTLMWWSISARNRKFHKYWFVSAREIEKQLSDSVKTIERGEKISRGDVEVIDGTEIVCRWLERMRIATILHLFYVIFLAIFVGLGGWNVVRIVAAF